LGRAWGGSLAGFATAVAYTYAPYTLYDSVRRGTVSEFAALATLPYVLWAFWRVASFGRVRDLLLAVVCFALFIPMHNVITLHSATLLLIYAVFLVWRSPARRRTFVQLAAVFILALGLTMFFWLPALAETDYVKINAITATLPDIDVVKNLTNIASMFSLPLTADPTQLQPPVPIALSLPQIALGIAALVLATFTDKGDPAVRPYRVTSELWLWLAAWLIAGLVFLNTSASAWVWQSLPLIRYSQFPWRLLGLASLLLALLAGIGVALVAQRIPARAGQVVWIDAALLMLIVYALPWEYGSYLPDLKAENIVDAQNFERETGWVATSSFGEYLPRWNQQPLDANRLVARYAQSEVIPRLDPPPGVTLQAADWGTTSARLILHADAGAPLTFDWLYFPGWWAKVDGKPLTIASSDPQGLVSLTFPAGTHTLEMGLIMTSLEWAATLASLGTLLAIGSWLLVVVYRTFALSHQPSAISYPQPADSPHHSSLSPQALVFLLSLGLAVFAVKTLWLDHAQTPVRRERFANGIEAGVQHPLQANFDNRITLLGYDLPDGESVSADTVSLNLYWQLRADPLHEDYSSVVHVRDAEGNLVLQSGSFYPGELATHNWLPGYYVQERLSLHLPSGTPPGSYTLDAGLFDAKTQHSLNVINAQGNPEDVVGKLGRITLMHPVTSQQPEIANPMNAALTDDIHLAGFKPLPDTAQVGQALSVEWYWRASAAPSPSYRARLSWLDDKGNVAASSPDMPPVVGYATDLWATGDTWRGLHSVYVPGRLDAGTYQVTVQLADQEGKLVGNRASLEKMQVTTPQRQFSATPQTTVRGIELTDGIELLGYDLPQPTLSPDDALSLTLYWKTQRDLQTDLRIFVHLVDTNGHIAAQQDGAPDNWARPTTGWTPGEVVTDPHDLALGSDLQPGEYTLQVGWYDPATDQRISFDAGGDFWVAPPPILLIPKPPATAIPAAVESLVPHIFAKMPHDTGSFTEGLLWDNGTLYESAGEYGTSDVRQVDPQTGKVLRRMPLAPQYFGEGLALVDTHLIQLTWKENTAFVYDRDTFNPVGLFTYEGVGWGLCYDGHSLYMSNGSSSIAVRDPKTFAVVRQIPVTLDGEPVANLNELECVGDRLYANVWLTDNIVKIDKTSGRVLARIDAAGLLTPQEIEAAGNGAVLNGIAYNPERQTFYITGKYWTWMFEVRFVPPGD
jgi:glutamine cyclotransferase